ncbi:MAG: carboxypeptidase-like regulatory domain-containing protein, partial [Segetibacter sp.]|nr:carboxypeptidase-like regulatory domain-containing protein [Segetibacter sp.]
MKKIFLLFVSFLTINFLTAQVKIQGQIKDNRNHPIQGVSISLKDSYDGATTDSTGNFSFRTTETGEHILIATSIGYNAVEQKILIGKEPITLNI